MTEGYFKMKFPYMCLGLILIETTTEPAGFDDYIKYTVKHGKESFAVVLTFA